jgi:hypothetical protein
MAPGLPGRSPLDRRAGGSQALDLRQVLRLADPIPLELRQVLRLADPIPLELRQVLRLPNPIPLDLRQVVRLPDPIPLDTQTTSNENGRLESAYGDADA